MNLPTNLVAWYGALVATVGIIIHLLNYLRDRSKVRITLQTGMGITGVDGTQIVITAANVGRRPVHLKLPAHVTTSGEPNTYMVASRWSNSDTINEGQSTSIHFPQSDVDVDKLLCAIVHDQTGKAWKGKIRRRANVR